jgi:sulfoxide reductase catalytic subunit YedY
MALSTLGYGKNVLSGQEEEKRSIGDNLSFKKNSSFHPKDKLTSFKDVTRYNNFYEFGTRKGDPSRLAPHMLKTKPWSIVIDGLVEKEQRVGFEELLALSGLEERIYKLRCVEGWSMVIPWIGYSLSELIKFAKPLGSAKYIAFRTLADREMMPGNRWV